MVYSTDSAKWKAYEFSDPFAAGLFVVCNKVNKFFCRPDCDARPTTNLKLEVKFVDTISTAINYGFVPCEHCDPLGVPIVDVSMLMECVNTISKEIGFVMPESENDSDDGARRSSAPVINFKKDTLSKNDTDHYRLVDLACRHLALAAASNLSTPRKPSNDDGKKRRRGGVLGFKELAAKSKLSAWHFHRVFKSVTGLTPKTYGDRCWEFMKGRSVASLPEPSRKRKYTSYSDPVSPIKQLPKKVKIESPIETELNIGNIETSMPAIAYSNLNTQLNMFDKAIFKDEYVSPDLFSPETILPNQYVPSLEPRDIGFEGIDYNFDLPWLSAPIEEFVLEDDLHFSAGAGNGYVGEIEQWSGQV